MSAKRRVILIVNSNTSPTTTAMMQNLATLELRGSGMEAVGIAALRGPRMLIDTESLKASAVHILDVTRSYLAGLDGADVLAVIVAAIGDPGRQELSGELMVPVVGKWE